MIPTGLSGEYFVFVQADSGDAVYEYTDQQSNVARAPGVFDVLSSPVIVVLPDFIGHIDCLVVMGGAAV